MPKATILDRLAGAMETLGKREGKALTPRQRVAAAQRFNELGSIGQSELASMAMDDPSYPEIHRRLNKMGLINNEGELQDNPFLSDNIDKYAEQDEFLDWCRYNRVRPSPQSLKEFRWQTYMNLPKRQRQWIANRDDIMRGFIEEGQNPPPKSLQELDDLSGEWLSHEWDFMDASPYRSIDEMPDFLLPGWNN